MSAVSFVACDQRLCGMTCDSIPTSYDIYYNFIYMKQTDVGQKIRQARVKAGMTQSDLADKLGLSWEMISRYERGVNSPMHQLTAIARALDVTVSELLQEYDKSSVLYENHVYKIPFVVDMSSLQRGKSGFRLRNGVYFYGTPEWVRQIDGEVFALLPSLAKDHTGKIRKEGAVFVLLHNSLSDLSDLYVLYDRGSLSIKTADQMNDTDKQKILGPVLGQDVRFISE